MTKQAINQTAYPDGTVVKYLNGMDRPVVKDLSNTMKRALMIEVNKQECKVNELVNKLKISV